MTDEEFTVDGSNPVAQFVDFLFGVSERIGDLLKLDAPDGKAREFFDGDSNTRWKSNELHRAAFNDAKTPRLAEAVRIAQEAFLECYEAAYSVTQFDAKFSDFETAKEKLNSALGEIIPFLPPAPLNTLAAQSSGIKKGSKKSSNRKPYSDDDKKLKERWQKAREAGVLKRKFCDDENITPKELGAAIDRSDYYSGNHRKKI